MAARCTCVVALLASAAAACAQSFAPRLLSHAANEPVAIASADIDGDGDLDVLCGSADGFETAWFENDGHRPPRFTRHLESTLGPVTAVLVVDLDGDSDNDLVCLHGSPAVVRWFRRNANGTFTGQNLTGITGNPVCIAAANLDNDADADLVIGIAEGDLILARNDGAPTFSISATIAFAANSIAIDRIDIDGRADIFAASNSTLAWFRNLTPTTGTPTLAFGTANTLAGPQVGISYSGAITAQVTSDTRADLAAIRTSGLLQRGIDWFANRPGELLEARFHATPFNLLSIGAGDVDGDSLTDWVWSAQDRVGWSRSEGPGAGFTPLTITDAAVGPRKVLAADLDDNGRTDIVATAFFNSMVVWYESLSPVRNDTTLQDYATITDAIADAAPTGDQVSADPGQFLLEPTLDFQGKALTLQSRGAIEKPAGGNYITGPGSVIAASPDEPMLLGGDLTISAGTLTLSAPGDARLSGNVSFPPAADSLLVQGQLVVVEDQSVTPVTLPNSAGAACIIHADLNGDTLDEIIVAGGAQGIWWYRLDSVRFTVVGAGFPWTNVVAADFDGDGDTDLAATGHNPDVSPADRLMVFRNNGGQTPTFTQVPVASPPVAPQGIDAADFDGDGDIDLAAVGTGVSVWYRNDDWATTDTFTRFDLSATSDDARDVLAFDVDQNGWIDIVTVSKTTDAVRWYSNFGGQPIFTRSVIDDRPGRAPQAIAAADIDRDGDIDLFTISEQAQAITWHENGSGGAFEWRSAQTIGSGILDPFGTSLAACDFDDDGDMDLVTAYRGSGPVAPRVVLLENDGAVPPVFRNRDIGASITPPGAFVTVLDYDGDGDLDIAAGHIAVVRFRIGPFGEVTVPATATVTTTGGLVLERGGLRLVGSSLSMDPGRELFISPQGSLIGESGASVFGDVANTGFFAPGVGFTISGNLRQSAMLADGTEGSGSIELLLTGEAPGESDQLVVGGNVSLAGGLRIFRAHGFLPTTSTLIKIIDTAGETSNTFDVAFLPALPPDPGGGPQLFMRVIYGEEDGGVSVGVGELGGSVGFGGPIGAETAGRPTDAVTADFDGINGPDLAVTVPSPVPLQPGGLFVFYNAGAPGGTWQGFLPTTLQLTTGIDPSGVAAGDIDKQDLADLVVVNRGSDTAIVYINNGAGVFAALAPLATGVEPTDVQVGDLDPDVSAQRFPDLVVVTTGDGDVTTYINNEDQQSVAFAQGDAQATAPGVKYASLTDVDNDKDLDTAVIIDPNSTVKVLTNDGDGNLTETASLEVGQGAAGIVAADLNGDELTDIVTSDSSGGTLSILLNTTDTPDTASFSPAVSLPVGESPGAVTALDVENDGDTDLVVVVSDEAGERKIAVLRNDSVDADNLAFAASDTLSTGNEPLVLLADDLDGDGLDDIISINDETEAIDDGVIGFPNTSTPPPPPCGSPDFDGDGDTGTDFDIEAFFLCLGGNCCATCGSADFDNDGDTGTDLDIEAFLRVLGGGAC